MKVARSSDIEKSVVEAEGAERVGVRWLISRQDGAEHFAMRLFEVEPGGHTPLHTHPHEHGVFVVEGEGVLVCEAAEHGFRAEDVIFVPGGQEHCFKNTGQSLLRLLCIIPADAS